MEEKPGMATPHKELIDKIMDSRVAKDEMGHAACREITELREKLKRLTGDGTQALAGPETINRMREDINKLQSDVMNRGTAILELQEKNSELLKAIETFLTDTSNVPPWESAGSIWATHVKRLHGAFLKHHSNSESK